MPDDATLARPAGYVTEQVAAFGLPGGLARTVDADNPLPVRMGVAASASAPLAGSATGSSIVGPFTPELGRAIWLTLSGTWSGTVALVRSVDGGATMQPLTVGGQAWGQYTANANEPVAEETVAAARYYLSIALTGGTLAYRVQQ